MQFIKQHRPDWPAILSYLRWSGLLIAPAIFTASLTVLLIGLTDRAQALRMVYPLFYLSLPVGAMKLNNHEELFFPSCHLIS
ncbi:MAG TPA: hypothetical protein VHD83_08140 [Puia sp.]|nr:hypothetical protein [Puia sp.]